MGGRRPFHAEARNFLRQRHGTFHAPQFPRGSAKRPSAPCSRPCPLNCVPVGIVTLKDRTLTREVAKPLAKIAHARSREAAGEDRVIARCRLMAP
jgi:hypothetical protein